MLSKVDKIILYCIFYSIPVALLIFFVYSSIFSPSTKQVIRARDSLENVNGVVDTLYNDDRNHDIRTAILKDKSTYQIFRNWESDIEIGDSLYKKQGSFLLNIYKKNGKKIVLDYRTTIESK